MESSLFIIALISLLISAILMMTMMYIMYNTLKNGNFSIKDPSKQLNLPDYKLDAKKKADGILNNSEDTKDKVKTGDQKHNCKNHPKVSAVSTCCICNESFCVKCLKVHKSLQFCLKHLEVFLMNQWEDIVSVPIDPNNQDATNFITNYKKKLWEERNIPTYVQTQYKINIEDDTIESSMVLYSKKEDAKSLRQEITA